MKEWKCVICGATALSKCIGQRKIHGAGGIKAQILASIISAEVIRANTVSEVIFSVTVSTDELPENALKARALDYLVEDHEILSRAYCDHIFVINSETENTCTLGCKHSNLKDEERLKAGYEKPKPADLDSITRQLCWAMRGMVERARKLNNIDTQVYDKEIEGQFEYLKERLSKLTEIGHGKLPFPRYRVTWGWDKPAAYFESLEQLNHFMLMDPPDHFYVEELDYDEQRYKRFPFKATRTCGHCGKDIFGLFWMQTDTGILHESCYKKLMNNVKVKRRIVRLKFNDISERVADRLLDTWESFGPDYNYEEARAERYTRNLRELIRTEAAYNVELIDYHYWRPEEYERDGKRRRFNGMNHFTFKGMQHDVDKVVEQLKEISK